MSLKFMTS